MKLILTLFLVAAVPVSSMAFDVENISFDELMGENFTEIIESAKSAEMEKVSFEIQNEGEAFEIPSVRMRKVSYEEAEMSRCPRNSEIITGEPDTDLFTYVGFKYIRSDDSTCLAQPSDKIYYQEAKNTNLSFWHNQGSSFSYDYETLEYRMKRYFFFRTQLDGTRRFYHYEKTEYTGKTFPERVELEFVNRENYPIIPWEGDETFRLNYGLGDKAALVFFRTNYEYKIESVGEVVDGNWFTKFNIKVVKKKKLTPPEKDAVSLTLNKEGDGLSVKIRDIRARSYYKDDKIGLKIKLWRNVLLFDDKVAYEIDINLDTASDIVIDFSDSKWDSFKKEGLKKWREYYVEWSFRRVNSNISSDEWIEKEESNRIRL